MCHGQLKMTLSTNQQSIYKWSQLDQSSYFHLKATDPKAFHCWTSMLKLLDQNAFQQFINNQIENNEQGNDKENLNNEMDQELMAADISLDQIVKIDNRHSIVKILNKVIIIEQEKLYRTLKSVQQQIEIIDSLVLRRNYIDYQIEQKRKKYHINCDLEQWHQQLKVLEKRTIWNYPSQTTNIQDEQSIMEDIQRYKEVVVQDLTLEGMEIEDKIMEFYQPIDLQSEAQGKVVQINVNQPVDQRQQGEQQFITDVCSNIQTQLTHKGQWSFTKNYPNQIEILSQQRILMIMKNNHPIIVEWWQFNYESLNNLLIQKVNLLAAQTWSILLILLDQEQFYKIWKGEAIEPVSNINGELEEGQIKQSIARKQHLKLLLDFPETIIQKDQTSLIIKFKNYVKVFKQREFQRLKRNLQISEYEASKWKISYRQTCYTRYMKIFKQRFQEEQPVRITSTNLQADPIAQTNLVSKYQLTVITKNSEQIQIHKDKWIFDIDYPQRIDVIGKDTLKLQFKTQVEITQIQWRSFEYKSLSKLIDDKNNIQAGQAWSIRLILLDHEQFYKLWKGDYQEENNDNLIQDRQGINVDQNQEQNTGINKKDIRDPPDYIPERIVKLDKT